MTVLVFGFEPFREFDENPSGLIAERLDGRNASGQEVVGRTLPVDYSAVEGEVLSAIRATMPSLILGFGLAAGRDKVTPEKVAINYVGSKMKDNSGRVLEGARISAGQPDAFFTDLPVEKLVNELNRESIPASLSLSAGGHLCNFAMFVCLREARKSGFGAGFVHLPCHAEWVASRGKQFPSLPFDTLVHAAELSVEFLQRGGSNRRRRHPPVAQAGRSRK